MWHIYFKQTMDRLGIKGSTLADAAGCSRNNISEIRTGKTNPSINRFWELVEICENIVPGFKNELGRRISVDRASSFYKGMDEDELADHLVAIGNAWKGRR